MNTMANQLQDYIKELEANLRQQADELRRSRDLLRVIFDNLPEGLLLLDAHGTLLAANQTFCSHIVGRRPQDVVGCSYRQLWHDLAVNDGVQLTTQGPNDESQPLIPALDQSFGAQMNQWRILYTDLVGQQRWFKVERVPFQRDVIEPQWIERWRDVTRDEALKRRFLLQDQLANLGHLAASVAHEVGNPLQSAMSCLELCREDRTIGQNSREYLNLALGELERMGRTMERLRQLYRPPQLEWEPVDLNQVLRQVTQFTRRKLHQERVQIDLDLAYDLPPIIGQADALRQVFLNLILNAQEAMPQGGTVWIASRHKATDRACQIVVSDTGVGISPELLPYIFEPFRSGKAQGVGLGLYLCQQIVEQHAGSIEVQSHLDAGTTFSVLLPWSDATPQHDLDEE
ncbi:MAG: PAS domain-containing protein [Candidatus Viridilinea halotolerans]|uniref:histidine kinase n=1 Tax=Candidatus Viridilinea halotolerans TaxID=2491704 RepID=A0A426TV14_9CHLR|nr:MAG: PAS domain-containing protein [Candidatus Viridilinea halotolerans]